MADKTEFLAGVVVGALVGVGLGMLFAPQSGEQTRRQIRGRAGDVGDRVRSSTQDMTARLRTTAEDVGDRMRERADDLARRGRTAYEEGTRRLREAYERGRESIQPRESGLDEGEQI